MANLLVNIGANIDALKAGLGKAESQLQDFGKKAQSIGLGLTKTLSVSLAAVGTAAFANTVRIGNYADKLLDLEQQTGLSTDALQKYRAVATQAGIATDAVANASENLQRRLASGEEGSADLVKGLESIGVASRDASGGLRSIDSVVEETIKKLADIEDITQRNQLAFKIFGRSASELAPLLSLGSAGIEEATQKAEKLGLVLSRDALEAANAFRVEFDFLKSTLASVGNELGVAFIPIAKQLVDIIQNNVIPVVKAITGFFAGLSDRTKTVIAVIAGLVAAIGPLLAGLGFFITTILPALKAGLIAITALFSPLVLKIVAITAVVVGLGLVVKGLIDAWDTVGEFFSQLWDKIKLLFINGVKNTLIAFQKFTSIIGIEFQDTIDSLEANANRIQGALDAKPVVTLGDVFSEVGQSIKNTFTSVKDTIVDAMGSSKTAIEETTKAFAGLAGGGRTADIGISGGEDRSGVFANLVNFAKTGIKLKPVDSTEFIDSLNAIKQTVDFILVEGIQNTIGDFAFAIGDAMGTASNVLKAGASSILNSFSNILDNLGTLALKTGVLTLGIGKAVQAIGVALKTLKGPVAIIAGAALIALAGIARGAARSIGGGVGSGGNFGSSGVGSDVGSTFEGGGTQFLSNNIELALVPEITGDSIRFVLDKSNQYRN
jgi:hypothetical protein